MVVSLKHSKTSAKTDSADATLVQPSDWNAEHTLTAAQDTVLGRVSAGTGAIEEITVTAAGRALLDDASATAQRATLAAAGTAVSNTFTATQIMSGDGSTTAPINLSVSYAPSAPANGDIWFNNNRLTYRQASTSYTVPRNDAVTTWSAVQTFTASPIINVTDNTNAALRITQAGTGNALLVEDSANPDATPTVIDASGRVVVGHTAALSAGGTIAPFQVAGTSNATAMMQNYRYSLDTSPAFYTFAKSRSATIGGSGTVSLGDDLGSLVWRGDDGTNFVAGSIIGTKVDAAPSTGNMPSALFFSTSVSAGTVLERMRITSDGNVGIGTSTPTGKLSVVSVTNGEVFRTQKSGGANLTLLRINMDDSANTGTIEVTGAAGQPALAFATVGSERLRITSSGNVLVTSPTGLGYGTGSGGTVTQATNKSTAVTLNKPTGRITMNNAALAAGATVSFNVNNSLVSATDTVIVCIISPFGNYSVRAGYITGGNFSVYLTNTGSFSFSDAVPINFAIIKGATT